jgi:uncharacterized protein
MNTIYQFKGATLEFKDVDQKQGIVTGYFSAFNNVDSDGDIIRKGAYARTIRENGPKSNKPRIKHLLNHSPSQPLGNLTDLKEDDYGLYYESRIGTHTLGVDFLKMVESDLIKEHSIGFKTLKRNQLQDYEGYMKNPSVGWFELTELKLYEGSSLTAWGSNEATPLTGVKSLKADALKGRIERLEKFCRNTDASDETIELLLLEIKQLSQLVADLSISSTQAAEKAPEPPKGIKGLDVLSLQTVIQSQSLTIQNLF